VDPVTAITSQTVFTLPLSPRTGNGRDTPLALSVFKTITAGRQDLPSSQPGLMIVRVGKNFRDAQARAAAVVLAVDPVANTVTLQSPVPADYQVFATYWYNRITTDVFTFNVVNYGPAGLGQYTVTSGLTGSLLGVRFGVKTGLGVTVQWPSGSETVPDAILTGAGTAVPETVTVHFRQQLAQPKMRISLTVRPNHTIYTKQRDSSAIPSLTV
jgi:hypothetical protein